jgi:hypothetical protein
MAGSIAARSENQSAQPPAGAPDGVRLYERSFSEGRIEMLPTTLSLVGAVILALDIFAMVSVLIGSSGVMRKLLWIAVIYFLPFVGVLLYFLIGRSPADAHA